MKIGIIGRGFVGSAVKFGFSPNVGCDAETKVFDVDPQKSTHSLNEVVNDSDFVFISVPTPSDINGKILVTAPESNHSKDIIFKWINLIREIRIFCEDSLNVKTERSIDPKNLSTEGKALVLPNNAV